MDPAEPEPAPRRARALGRTSLHWLVLATAAFGVLVLLALRVIASPDPRGHGTHEQLGLPACSSMELFGLPCPGCGVTTATAWAVRGELARAAAVQPFGLIVAASVPLMVVWCLAHLVRGRDLGLELERLPKRNALLLGGLLLLGCWAYKLALTLAG